DRVRRAMRDEAGPIEIEGPHELREMAVGLNRIVVERRQLEFEVRHRQKMEAVGRLAGEIAHDFNNVLTVISSGADLAALDLTEEHPALEPVEEIRAAAARATALTGQLLSFSRKKSEELVERVDVNALISGLEGMLGRVIGREVQLRTDLSAEAPLIMGDSDQLEQSLMNLAVNAGDAMPDGGTFTIRTERIPSAEVPTVIDLDRNGDAPDEGGVRDKDWLHIVVSDTGHGISPEIEERIFEPFFTTKAAGHGTGLGLATVYAAVRRFGGRIDVRSRVGDGTDFHIYFPAAGEGDEPG
ncbi:MAG: ATP-binding protein, partial [Halobacteriales archaeon]|nr:ATP-binding protein [Halobacteriales archaeon]